MLNIIIPIQEETWKLEECVNSVEKYTSNFTLTIHKAPDLNVAQARQQALDENKERYVCFLDDDSRVLHTGWSENLINALDDTNVVSFAGETWGEYGELSRYEKVTPVHYGPAACMMVDTTKLPVGYAWDKYIGLSSGWLGGDYEEYDYIQRLPDYGLQAVGVPDTQFLHVDRVPLDVFRNTDRFKTGWIMDTLISYRNSTCKDPEFFKKLEYVRADPNNDLMLASGKSLKDCFSSIIKDNGLGHLSMWTKLGIL